MSIITNLFSWPFANGLLAGFLLSRIWEIIKVCRLDRLKPLPGGKHRSWWKAVQVDPRWLAGFVAVMFLSWSVYTTSENASDTHANAASAAAFAGRVQDCQALLIRAIIDSRKITAENEKLSADNDRLSQEERKLLAQLAKYQAEWLGKLIDPPDPRIRNLAQDNPIRQQYNIDESRAFFNRAGEINTRIDGIHAEQDRNDAARPTSRPALPDPECGN